MNKRFGGCLLLIMPMLSAVAQAAEFTGRFSMLGATARAEAGDIGYVDGDHDTLTADQQSLRLMLDGAGANREWSLHLKTVRQHLSGYPAAEFHSSDLFRYRDLANDWLNQSSAASSTRAGYEFDRAVYKQRFDKITLGVGRQPIDWGSGRFWQPLNVFGAFAPTDLDTDFKPGIDAATLDWYPSAFSSLTAAYVLAPENNSEIDDDSGAVYYRRQVGDASEISVLGGVVGNSVVGGAFESSLGGMGWRIEAAFYNLQDAKDRDTFWIAGIDYQFEDGTLIMAEWYDNNHGATTESELAGTLTDAVVVYGLQQQMGRRVLGVAVERDITPLWHGGYTLLASTLKDVNSQQASSLLHQLNFTYSVSNESDLLLSMFFANGKGLNLLSVPQSEFGHLPASMTVRLRFYF